MQTTYARPSDPGGPFYKCVWKSTAILNTLNLRKHPRAGFPEVKGLLR